MIFLSAFGHADVVLLCFSICSAQSLANIKRFWYDEESSLSSLKNYINRVNYIDYINY